MCIYIYIVFMCSWQWFSDKNPSCSEDLRYCDWFVVIARVERYGCSCPAQKAHLFPEQKWEPVGPILHHYAFFWQNHILLYSYIYNLRFQGDSEVFNPKVTSFQDWNLNSPGFVASSKPRHITAKRGYQILHSHGPQVSTKT